MPPRGHPSELYRMPCPPRAPAPSREADSVWSPPLLDVIYILTAFAVFAVVGLVALGVERLVPQEDASVRRGGAARRDPSPSAAATPEATR